MARERNTYSSRKRRWTQGSACGPRVDRTFNFGRTSQRHQVIWPLRMKKTIDGRVHALREGKAAFGGRLR